MNIDQLQRQRQFHVHQRTMSVVNRYEIFADDGAGQPGLLVAFAEQPRATLKEHLILYTDAAKQTTLVTFNDRKVTDLAGTYDVTTPQGELIGVVDKKFGESLFRSTWQLDQYGQQPVTVRERSGVIALFRRLWEFIPWGGEFPFPWKYHFDLFSGATRVGTVEKKNLVRDHYRVRLENEALDRRLVLAQAVALDVLQAR